MGNLGVHPTEGGFNWTCGCGTSGATAKDRDAAREEFKQHRRSHTTGAVVGAIAPKAPQQKKPIQTPGGERTMAVAKKAAAKKTAKGSNSKPRELAVTEKVALAVIEKIKAGKTTVMAAARDLKCYHATLRKALRRAMGEKEYAKLMEGKQGARPTAAPTKAKPVAKKAAKPVAKKAAKPEPEPTPPEVEEVIEEAVEGNDEVQS